MSLGRVSAVAAAIALCGACSGQGSGRAQASSAPQGEPVTAVGCPTQAAESQCLTIAANGKVYDLAGANVDMSRNVGVSIRGRAAGEATECGLKLTDVKVEYLGLSCGMAPDPYGPDVKDPYR
ncbi:MAG: hypothetical protein ACK41C_20730 [Phenylobacterium sp.]|uniref:hypothetical protein n=1 Tax=Phenylobacterium sp. TaxID=1871053 RepID=UPI00391DE07C